MKTPNEVVLEVATEMMYSSMQNITAQTICNWASRLGEAARLDATDKAKSKKALGEAYNLIDKAKTYINDIEPIDRKREFSHCLTRAKNLVDNIMSQVSVEVKGATK